MRLARSTIVAPVPGRSDALLVQPLSGQAALLPLERARALEGGGAAGLDEDERRTLAEAGILVDGDADEAALRAAALESFAEELYRTPTQLIVVPTFACNLRCGYCYQEAFEPEGKGLIAVPVLEQLFAYLDAHHLGEEPRPYLTLFGGEPLHDSPAHRDRLARVLAFARARSLEVAVVTNGYELLPYLELLREGPIKEVQITLDGPAALHDARRPHVSGAGSFARIVAGLEGLLAAGVPVNLRVVVDRENLPALPELARLALERGWLERPEERFRTQLGRNYELFGCHAAGRAALLDRVELWAALAALAEDHPELRRFHRPRFHGIRHLVETGELPAPSFDACPATKTEWAFAPEGAIYGCTATVGHPAHRLGRFAPTVERDEAAIARYRGRSALTIPACRECALAPICGGGCAALAARGGGDLAGPDCRPVRELLGLGAAYYRLGLDGAGTR
jgi:uncharacterized protein